MNTKVPTRYFLVPCIYLILIAFFVYLHFFSFDTTTDRLGPITLEAKHSGTAVQSLTVSRFPLTFRFSGKEPLHVEFEDGSRKSVTIEGYTTFPDGIEIRFTDDLLLRISNDDQRGRRTAFQFYSGNPIYNSAILHISYLLAEDTDWITAGRIPVLSLIQGGEHYVLSSSQGSLFDPEHSLILLTSEDEAIPALVLQSTGENSSDPLTFWFSRDALKVKKEEFEATVDLYIEDSYRGWQDSRYNRTSGEWTIEDGSSHFSESLLNAFFSEAITRGEYEQMFLQVSGSVGSHQSELSYLTMPFFGNLTETYRQLREHNDKKAKTVASLIAEEDFSVFSTPDLLLFAINHGPFSLVEEIYQLARIAECSETNHSTCLDLLKTFLDGTSLQLPNEEIHIDWETLIEERVLPWITKTEEGLFLGISKDIVDTVTSLKAGFLLIQAGEKVENDTFVSIGRYLVISVLSLSDAQGFLPEKMVIQNGKITERHERVSPETVYSILKKNPYYRHEISLHKEIAPGAWMLTCADIKSLDMKEKTAEITLSFPKGMSHHLIIQGVPPFTRMQFYEINWVSDPSFEAYSSGWAYNAETETLFIKLRHRQEQEKIKIFFTE